jgi:hypothetical protein
MATESHEHEFELEAERLALLSREDQRAILAKHSADSLSWWRR